ncbi:F/Y-rich N-terminus-domain-containing protein [Phycomyces nitens]|nr:F/Y-rich N-terminus-domain-containing protein [Phycomyces nitens]
MITKHTAIDAESQSENQWNDDHMRKYRSLKRKIIEFIAKQRSAQLTIDKANRRIQALQRENRRLLHKSKGKGDAMDVSPIGDDDDAGEYDEDADKNEEEDQLDENEDEEMFDDLVLQPKRNSTSRKRQEIPRDSEGNVIFPFSFASLKVLSLGTIMVDQPAFHNDRYIYPVGYSVERTYMSMVNPDGQTTYTCTVKEQDNAPLFTIRAADAPSHEISGQTPTGAWSLVIKQANLIRQKDSTNAISGPEYYGFSHPLVIEMIEELDGVDKCSRYIRRS